MAPLAGMALQVERRAVLQAGLKHRREPLDQQFEADLVHVGNRMAAQRTGQRRKQEPVAPAVRRRADEARDRHDAIFELADEVRQPHGGDQRVGRLLAGDLGHVVRHVKRIGPRRIVAGGAPLGIGFDRFAAQKLQRLGGGLVAQGLALQMGGQREDFQAALLGLVDALLGIGLGAGVVGAAFEIQLPGGFLPAVEAGLGDPVEPLVLGHVAELAAHQADLMMRMLAAAMRLGLVMAHGEIVSRSRSLEAWIGSASYWHRIRIASERG